MECLPIISPLLVKQGYAIPSQLEHFKVNIRMQNGYTVILVPRSDNLETKAIKTAYSATAGTAYVTFDQVRVPIGNTLGTIGKGMAVILSNFNHEVRRYRSAQH